MSQTIRVKIGDAEYSLRGNDEDKIRRSAQEVDSQFTLLRNSLNEQSTVTLSILSALNLAEKYHEGKSQLEVNIQYMDSELRKMKSYVHQVLSGRIINKTE